MNRRHVFFLMVGSLALGMGAVSLAVAVRGSSAPLPVTALAQLAVTTTPTLTTTVTDTPRPSATPTLTATPSPTSSPTESPSPLPTLSTRVLRVTSVHPDVALPTSAALSLPAARTQPPAPTVVVPTPALLLPLLPTLSDASRLYGWYSVPADAPAVLRTGTWDAFAQTYRATQRRYLYTDAAGARLTYRFLGAAVRVRYAAFHSYGVFQVAVDGRIVATVDSYRSAAQHPRGDFLSTEVFRVPHGWHTVDILRLGRKAPDSTGTFVAIDAIDVYLHGPAPTLMPTVAVATPMPMPSPRPAVSVVIVAAPPTVRPTLTLGPPAVTGVDFSAAYDLNNNKSFDPLEGIAWLSVRLVRADTNRVLAAGFTDREGFVRLEATGNVPLRLVVPYFGKYWDIPATNSTSSIRLLFPAANQPGLIP